MCVLTFYVCFSYFTLTLNGSIEILNEYTIMILGLIIDIHFYETFSNPSANKSACASLLIKTLSNQNQSFFAWPLNYFCKSIPI
jgi:hypothetical protein